MRYVYVVMGNDFPEEVFSTQKAAEEYCERMRAMGKTGPSVRVYWRWYKFTVRRR